MILIADLFSLTGIKTLEEEKHEVVYDSKLDGESLDEAVRIHQPTVLVVRSTKVRVSTIDASSKLALIIRAGAGTDTIDVAYASSKGVYVAN